MRSGDRGTQRLPPADLGKIGLVELASHLDGVTAQQQPQRRMLLIDNGNDHLGRFGGSPCSSPAISRKNLCACPTVG